MYEHKLVFECEVCNSEIALSEVRFENNLENVDSNQFDLLCHCGSQVKLFGIQAKKHWTEPIRAN